MKHSIGIFLFSMIAFLSGAQSPGTLDLSYGSSGKALVDWNHDANWGNAFRYATDGSIFICGENGYANTVTSCLLAKLQPNGLPDLSFGTNGIVQFNYGGTEGSANDLIVFSDGRILVAGYSYEAGNYSIGLAKFTPQGTPDLTFGFSGKLIVNIGDYEVANSIIKLTNNKFAIAGSINQGNGVDMLVMRFLSNGSADVSFDSDGYAVVDLNNNSGDAPRGMVLHNNKILVSSYALKSSYDAVVLVQFNDDGSLDNSFGISGKSVVDGLTIMDWFISPGTQMAIDYQNRIVVSGQFQGIVDNDAMLLRCLPNGYPDNSFGDYGLKVYSIPNDNDLNALAIQPDGKILASGSHSDGNNRNTFLLRALENGNLDPAFGNGMGYTYYDLGSGDYKSDYSMAMLLNGNKVLLCGHADTENSDIDFCVSRYYLGVVTNNDSPELSTRLTASIDPKNKNCLSLKGDVPKNERIAITLVNQKGQICNFWETVDFLSSPNINIFKIDHPLSAGIYIVNVSSKNFKATDKVVIQ